MATVSFSYTQNGLKLLGIALALVSVSCATTPSAPPPAESKTPSRSDEARSHRAPPVSLPRVGIILGPGGLKSFAHIGVLRELERAHVPVRAVVGLEWGALVGGLYALKGTANDVEWKMLKLKKEELPVNGTLFRASVEPKDVSALDVFFKEAFENKTINTAALKFACPYTTLDGERVSWAESGLLSDAVGRCLPFPPLYRSKDGSVASVNDVKEAAKILRDSGAEVVILVNVLAQGVVVSGKKKDAAYETRVLWNSVRRQLAEDHDGIDFVIGVHTRDYDIMNFESRRSLILFGSQAGMIAAKKLAEKYGF